MGETAVKAIHPVYVDGPLKGQDFPVTEPCRQVQALDPEVMHIGDPDAEITGIGMPSAIVTYTLQKFGFRSGDGTVMLWLGVSGPGEPDAEVLADLLLSDAAKAARA